MHLAYISGAVSVTCNYGTACAAIANWRQPSVSFLRAPPFVGSSLALARAKKKYILDLVESLTPSRLLVIFGRRPSVVEEDKHSECIRETSVCLCRLSFPSNTAPRATLAYRSLGGSPLELVPPHGTKFPWLWPGEGWANTIDHR
jgi:hypothetical protein